MHLRLLAIVFLFSINITAQTIIDVRSTSEWDSGHLETAIHVEWQSISDITSYIDKNEEIYLYCRSGNRSGKAMKILLDNGFINVINAGSINEASQLLNIKISN